MSADPSRVRDVFFGALEAPRTELEAYLRDACGDDGALRAEVESLLAFHDDAELVTHDGLTHTAHLQTLVAPGLGLGAPELASLRYTELSELGVGGCGRVTRTYDRYLRRVVAHKQLLRDNSGQRAMLLQEARLLAYLDHPGAVAVYDGVASDSDCFYTMRLLDGDTLRERIGKGTQLTIREAVRILGRVSETMANAHAKGVLHLDLKPENIMLLPYGQVCILDWGVSRFYDLTAYQAYLEGAGDPEPPDAAGYSGIAGTPAYMPIEQVTGEDLTPASDVFAAGTILYEMLLGLLPYPSGPSRGSVLSKATQTVSPPRDVRADIPERLEALCLRMIQHDPEARPVDFEEVLAELAALSHGGHSGQIRHLEQGEVLFREGDVGTEAFHIRSGAVVVTVRTPRGDKEVARRSVGDLVGEMAVVSGAPRSATVAALEPTEVAVVTGAVIEEELKSANPLLARMLTSMTDRLRELTDKARQD